MRSLFKLVIGPGEEANVRKAAAALPPRVEGLDAVEAFFRGNVLYLATDGDADAFGALAKDAAGRKLVAALRDAAFFRPELADDARLARLEPTERARTVVA